MTGSIDKLSANLMLIVPHHHCSTCYNATIFHVSRSYLAHSLVSQSIIQCYALQPTMFLLHLSYLAIESKWFHVPYLYLAQLISLLWSWNPSNSLWPSDCMWWHRSRSKLAKVMACCYQHQAITISTKPLPETIFTYHQLGPVAFTWWQNSRECQRYHSQKHVWKFYI